MIVLLDGYNILKALENAESTHQRDLFVSRMRRYFAQKKLQGILVFDGGPGGVFSHDRHKPLEVIFTGARQSADEYIKEYIDSHRGADILVVSSDRELRSYAKMHAVISLSATEFLILHKISSAESNNEKQLQKRHAVKTAQDENLELDELMNSTPTITKSDTKQARQARTEKVSKKERALWQKIKKL